MLASEAGPNLWTVSPAYSAVIDFLSHAFGLLKYSTVAMQIATSVAAVAAAMMNSRFQLKPLGAAGVTADELMTRKIYHRSQKEV